MFNTIRDRFNWQSRKTRLGVAAAVCAAGLGIGLGISSLLTQRAMAEPPTTYCLYSISIPPPPGCNAFHTCPVPYTGQYFYAVQTPSGGCQPSEIVCGFSVPEFGSGGYSGTCP